MQNMFHKFVALSLALFACMFVPAAPSAGAGPIVDRAVPMSWHPNVDWKVDTLNGTVVRASACGDKESDIATFTLELDEGSLPDGATLVDVDLIVDPCDDGRSLDLPDNRPVIEVAAVDLFGNSVSSGGAQDQSRTLSEYLAPHRIHLEPNLLPPIDRRFRRYVLRYENEYGADAVGGMRILGLKIHYSFP